MIKDLIVEIDKCKRLTKAAYDRARKDGSAISWEIYSRMSDMYIRKCDIARVYLDEILENPDTIQAIHLHYIDGLSWSEVGRLVGKPAAAIRGKCKNLLQNGCY